MALHICSLNSGSNGNCYYIGSEREAVLIDAGLSCKETESRMARMGLSMQRVKAIFISHEHTDHTHGVEVIARKFRIPVFITSATKGSSRLRLDPQLTRHFVHHSPVIIGGLTVIPFHKKHDATDPHSFTISGNGVTVGVLTDLGTACEHVIRNFSQCHAAFLEANYDENMLMEGSYPVYLKRRISSEVGHLSNHQALELFNEHRSPFMSHLLLSHLSEQNNHPKLVQELFSKYADGVHIAIASRFEPSALYSILAG
jgi:phosphoribosyl 1,2-cyclic phosphodiesterase